MLFGFVFGFDKNEFIVLQGLLLFAATIPITCEHFACQDDRTEFSAVRPRILQ